MGYGFECLQKAGEVCEAIKLFGFSKRQRLGVVARAQFHQRGGQNGAFEVQMQLGFGQTADKILDFHHSYKFNGRMRDCSNYGRFSVGRFDPGEWTRIGEIKAYAPRSWSARILCEKGPILGVQWPKYWLKWHFSGQKVGKNLVLQLLVGYYVKITYY